MDQVKQLRKARAAFWVSMTVIVVAIGFLVTALYMAYVPVNVVKANTQPYQVITPVIKAGENLTYIADVCKNKQLFSNVTRTFVDQEGTRYPIVAQASRITVGCHKKEVVVPTLPTFKPGTWYLSLDVQYKVNPLRTQNYHFETQKFEIR